MAKLSYRTSFKLKTNWMDENPENKTRETKLPESLHSKQQNLLWLL